MKNAFRGVFSAVALVLKGLASKNHPKPMPQPNFRTHPSRNPAVALVLEGLALKNQPKPMPQHQFRTPPESPEKRDPPGATHPAD